MAGVTVQLGGVDIGEDDVILAICFMPFFDDEGEACADLMFVVIMPAGEEHGRIRGRLRIYADDRAHFSKDPKKWFDAQCKQPGKEGAEWAAAALLYKAHDILPGAGDPDEFRVDGTPARFIELTSTGCLPSWMNARTVVEGSPEDIALRKQGKFGMAAYDDDGDGQSSPMQ
jgi:hypothetical protein